MTINRRENILYTKFQTNDHYYVYDPYSNEILQVSNVVWDIIDDYLNNQVSEEEIFKKHDYIKEDVSTAIKEIKEGRRSGYLQPIDIKYMFFYDSNEKTIEEIKHNIKSLGLEVTTHCNFRCKYCIYSENYCNFRSHEDQNMDWTTAQNAIMLFMQHSSKAERKNIGFWGGEPLLNFKLIQDVVHYVQEKYPNENIIYSLTTNGSLFTDENIDFFLKHKFNLLVSLNGPQHIHDKYRVDINKNGTFHRVIQGLTKIINVSKAYYDDHIDFNCILTPGSDFDEVAHFFSQNRLFENRDHISISMIDDYQTTFFDKHGYYLPEQLFFLNKIYYKSAVNGSLEKETFIKMLKQQNMLNIFRRCRHKLEERIFPNGCCIPLQKRIHVDVNGNIHTCERVPLYNPLGNVNEKGIDYNLIVKFIEEYTQNSLKHCKYCWALRMCQACYKFFMKDNKWNENGREEMCNDIRKGILADLMLYSLIIEKNPKAFDYMKNIKISI